MPEPIDLTPDPSTAFTELLEAQSEAARDMFTKLAQSAELESWPDMWRAFYALPRSAPNRPR